MSDAKSQNEQPLNVEQKLKQTADELQERIRYYSESEEGQEEVRQTVYQAGRVIGGAAGLVEGARIEEVEATMRLVELLERRAAVLALV